MAILLLPSLLLQPDVETPRERDHIKETIKKQPLPLSTYKHIDHKQKQNIPTHTQLQFLSYFIHIYKTSVGFSASWHCVKYMSMCLTRAGGGD